MSYLAEFYARFGGGPTVYGVVFVLGGLLATGAWWVVGASYERQQTVIRRADATDRELDRLSKTIDALQGSKVERERLNAVRAELGRMLGNGVALRERCRTDPPEGKVQQDADAWFGSAQDYIRDNLDASYLARFQASRPSAFQPGGVSIAREGLWHGLNARIETLEAFIKELASP